MWHSNQTLDRVRTNQNMRVYLRATLLLNNTIIRLRGVLDRDFDEREVTYKDRAMNAKKTVYLPIILPRSSQYLAVSVPIPNQPYSECTVLPLFTPRSTRSLFFVLFRVRRFILSSPSQNSPTKLPKPCL